MRCFDSVDGRKSLKVDSSKLFRLCGSFAFTIKKKNSSLLSFPFFFVILVSKYVSHVARQLQFSKAVSSLFLLLSKKKKKREKD